LDTERLKQQVVDELLMLVGTDRILTDALIDMTQTRIDDEQGWSLDDNLRKTVSVLFSEESRFHLEKLKDISLKDFHQLRTKLRGRLKTAKTDLKRIGINFLSELSDRGLAAKALAGGSIGIFNFFNKLSRQKFEMPTKTVIDNIHRDKWFGSKASEREKEMIIEWQDEILWKYQHCLELLSFTDQYQLVFDHIYGIALLEEMNNILQTIQKDEGILHIGEFNHVVSDVVMQESAPFIYERIGYRFHHLLVDEFQDTGVLQWFNLLPLVDESLAHDDLCLVVGDGKQSIYRWRGGDVQQFVELPAIHRTPFLEERLKDRPEMNRLLKGREKVLQNRAETAPLDTNYRSTSTIVNFNNGLFQYLQEAMPKQFSGIYDGCVQKPKIENEGLVETRFFRQEDDARTWDEYHDLTLDQVTQWIDACLADGHAPGDIAIICRKNAEAVRIAQFLIEAGYKVVSNESLLINSSPKVRLLINLAVYLIDDTDSINNAELVQHLGMARSEERLTSTRLMKLNLAKGSDALQTLLADLYPAVKWNRLNRHPLYSLFQNLVHGLFPQDAEAHLRFFMDEVLHFNRSWGNDLGAFIDLWSKEKVKASISLTENMEAIRILTVHKSKGLEFPIVIHPYSDYSNESVRNSIWVYSNDPEIKPIDRLYLKATSSLENTDFSADLDQERALIEMDMYNMLYVSLTRPRERLYVCGKLKKESTKDQSPATAIQFIYNYLKQSGKPLSDDLVFSSGTARKAAERAKVPTYLSLLPTGDPYWIERIGISRPSEREWRLTSDAIGYGLLMHDILSHIKFEDDIKPALQTFSGIGRISDKEIPELENKLVSILNKEELKPLFSSGKTVHNEADIRLASGKWLRPDRVVSEGETAWVIDYKTGVRDSNHRKQVSEYKDALYQLGFTDVNGMLVYLENEDIVAV